MKFSSYQRAVAPNVSNTPVVQAVRDPMAYGGAGRQYNDMAAAVGQVTKVATKQQDDQDAADVMDARNKIMTSLTEQLYGDNGLFVTAQGENSKGLTERTTQAVRKTFDDVLKNYNGRVRYAAQGNMNENMANFQRIAASKETDEKLATDKANYVSNLQLNTNLAAKSYAKNDALNTYINDSARLVQARAMQEGWSGAQAQAQMQNAITQVTTGAVNAAMDNDDFDRASEILQANRGQMDQDTYGKFAATLKKRQDAKDMDQQAISIFSQCWDGQKYDMTKAYKMATDLYGPNATTTKNGINMKSAISSAWTAWGNAKMDNGTEGCAEAATKFAGYWNPWAANEQKSGVVSAPRLVEDASAKGGPGVINFDRSKLQAGDMIVYDSPKQGENAHVVIYTGSGPDDYSYMGNSSGQNQTVQGSDYREMGGQTPTRIIKTGSVAGTERSAYDPDRLNKLKNVIDSYASEKMKEYELEHPRPRGGGGGGYRGGGGRSGGYTRRSSGYTGESGEYYSAAQIKRAQKLSNEYYRKSADPDATITDAQQERYDEAARILTDTGMVGSGDNLDSSDGYALAQAAWDMFKSEGDGAYTHAHEYLTDHGMSYDEATVYLDGI